MPGNYGMNNAIETVNKMIKPKETLPLKKSNHEKKCI